MEDYKPNSHKYREEQKEKKITKVVTGDVKTKKRHDIRKLADVFISEDVANVKSYVFMDVLVPAIKKAIVDIVTDGVNMIFFGGTGRSSKNSNAPYVSYRNYADRPSDRHTTTTQSSRFDYDDFVFNNRGDAEAVREQMEDVIGRYGFVTVADLYDMVERTPPYTSNKYGWTSVRNADIVRTRDGYVIKLSRPGVID